MRWMLDAGYSYIELVKKNKDLCQKPRTSCYEKGSRVNCCGASPKEEGRKRANAVMITITFKLRSR